MRRTQPLLFDDPRPLVKQLGGNFFRKVPKQAGVYLMRDAADRVLYVGKAKNLRQRLRNYRIADPDRMPRRHLRMVREVARIEFQLCPGETAALKRESKLLRSLRPKFNRAGVWPGKIRFLVWRRAELRLELSVAEVPETGWQRFGPCPGAAQLHATLSRLFWLALNPGRGFSELPAGWARGKFSDVVSFDCCDATAEISAALGDFFWTGHDRLTAQLQAALSNRVHPFERSVIEGELEMLQEFTAKQSSRARHGGQLALL